MRKGYIAELTQKIIAGYRLGRDTDRSLFLEAPLEDLKEGAYRLQRQFCGNHIDLCTIVNGGVPQDGCRDLQLPPAGGDHRARKGESGCGREPLLHRHFGRCAQRQRI